MTMERCTELAPNWDAQSFEPVDSPKPKRMRLGLDEWFRDFKRQNGIALIVLFAWAASMMFGCCVTGVIVKKRTTKIVTAEVESRMRADFQEYLDQLEEDQKAAQFLSGDASFEAAVADLADYLDDLAATYSMDFGLREDAVITVLWVFAARWLTGSNEFGITPQEILEKSGAWEGNPAGHAVRPQDTALATKVARDVLSGNYPDGFTPDMTFGTREAGGGFVARNQFITGPNTKYFRYGQ